MVVSSTLPTAYAKSYYLQAAGANWVVYTVQSTTYAEAAGGGSDRWASVSPGGGVYAAPDKADGRMHGYDQNVRTGTVTDLGALTGFARSGYVSAIARQRVRPFHDVPGPHRAFRPADLGRLTSCTVRIRHGDTVLERRRDAAGRRRVARDDRHDGDGPVKDPAAPPRPLFRLGRVVRTSGRGKA